MKDFLFGLTDELKKAQVSLYEKMKEDAPAQIAEDPEE
jgi:hypothetical protein